MDKLRSLKDQIEDVSWHNYTKKCAHCGKNNTYRMKKINIALSDELLTTLERAFKASYIAFTAAVGISDEHTE